MKVAVLGAGPSGLLASWAVIDAGHEPVIFERNPRKPDGLTAGVYYLHDNCNLPVRKSQIQIISSGGTADDYRKKVYGEAEELEVSFPSRRSYGWDDIWDGMQALDFCWDIVHGFIQPRIIESWQDVIRLASCYELVVNTIPLDILMPMRNWRKRLATIYRSTAPADEAYMLYNANPVMPWYRASAIFGAFTLEYPGGPNARVMEERGPRQDGRYVTVKKVMPSPASIPMLPKNVMLTGRFGAWDKSKLSHDAYLDVMDRLG